MLPVSSSLVSTGIISAPVHVWVNALDAYIRAYKNDLIPYIRELDSMPDFRIEDDSLYID